MPMLSTISDWAKLLDAMASSVDGPDLTDKQRPFADEFGHRRPVDRPFIAWLNESETGGDSVASLVHADSPDVALWAALASVQPVPAPVLGLHRRSDWRSNFDAGSLFPQRNESGPIAIEVWTEVELSSLHALAWLAGRDPSLRPLVRNTARWLIENLQPDNATNHPWAVHLFAAIGVLDSDPDASMYAQTLLHNCQVSQGRPDAFSALILRDSAASLRKGSLADWLVDADQD